MDQLPGQKYLSRRELVEIGRIRWLETIGNNEIGATWNRHVIKT